MHKKKLPEFFLKTLDAVIWKVTANMNELTDLKQKPSSMVPVFTSLCQEVNIWISSLKVKTSTSFHTQNLTRQTFDKDPKNQLFYKNCFLNIKSFVKKLEWLAWRVSSHKSELAITQKNFPKIEILTNELSKQVDEWVGMLIIGKQINSVEIENGLAEQYLQDVLIDSKVDLHNSEKPSGDIEYKYSKSKLHQLIQNDPADEPSLEKLQKDIKRIEVITTRKENHRLDFIKNQIYSHDKVAISYELTKASDNCVENVIDAITVVTGTFAVVFNFSPNSDLCNYHLVMSFFLDQLKYPQIQKIGYNYPIFVNCLKKLWNKSYIECNNAIDLVSTKYFSDCGRGKSDISIENQILRCLNVDLTEMPHIDWEHFDLNYNKQMVTSQNDKLIPKCAHLCFGALYKAHALLIIFNQLNQDNNIHVFNSLLTESFVNLNSQINKNRNEKYLADISFMNGYEILKSNGFRIQEPDCIRYQGNFFPLKKQIC